MCPTRSTGLSPLPWVAAVVPVRSCITAPTAPIPGRRLPALFAAIDRSVDVAAVRDQGPCLSRASLLRANRFLASFRDEIVSEQQFANPGWDISPNSTRSHVNLNCAIWRPMSVNVLARASRKSSVDCPATAGAGPAGRAPATAANCLAAAQVPTITSPPGAWWAVPLTAPFILLGVGRWQDQSHKGFY